MPEKWYRIFIRKFQIDELPEDSTEIFQCNMLDRCLDRPDESMKNGMSAKDLENDYQPVILDGVFQKHITKILIIQKKFH